MHILNRLRWGLLLTTVVGFVACTNNDVDPDAGSGGTPNRGSADFTRYVAVGNSLTAGFADATPTGGGLYRDGQLNAYPNILAGQFATVGGGAFVQPLFAENRAAGSGYTKLIGVPNVADPSSLIRSLTIVAPGAARGGTTTNGALLLDKFTDANQNLGVPGIAMANILSPGYGSPQAGNPYFERLLANPSATYLDYVSSNLTGATFFSCWLGNNDALGYAQSGGIRPLTEVSLFTTNYTALINRLTENGRKGVVVGIPSVVTTPYFTTLTDLISARLQAANIAGLVIQSRTAPTGIRQSRTGDYFLLANANALLAGVTTGLGLSATNPIPDSYVLDADEVITLNNRINEFNTVLKAQADAKGLAYVDPNAILGQVTLSATNTTGLVLNGTTYSNAFIQGGIYSLDGLHLTPAGYAFVANEIIKSINAKYGSTIAEVNPANYRRVVLQ